MENYKELTLDKLKEIIDDITFNNKSKLILFQGCLTNGVVERTGLDSKVCDNPNCGSCRNFEEAIDKILKEELKNISFKNGK